MPALWRSFSRALAECATFLGSMSRSEAKSILGMRQETLPTREAVAERARSLVGMNREGPGATSKYIIGKIDSAREVLCRDLE